MMMLGSTPYNLVSSLDQFLSRIQARCFERKGCLITLFFHGLFLDEKELRLDVLYPQQGITVRHFRQLIEYFLNAGYIFVSPPEILQGLDPSKRYALVTFDDGYFNNQRAVPILQEYKISALFFISANHVKHGKAFWWDVFYRIRRSRGKSIPEIHHEIAPLNVMANHMIEAHIRESFDIEDLTPCGDTDRPFTPDELRDFAKNEYVYIGNHTCNHAALCAYSGEEIHAEIGGAQELLEEMSGKRPQAIAYPNGIWSSEIANIAREEGLKLGFTAEPRKEYFPKAMQGKNAMSLGRFLPVGNDQIIVQCQQFRSDLMLLYRYQDIRNSIKGAFRY